MRKVVVTGGAGYVGALLVPKLLAAGHQVKVIDWYIYGEHVFDAVSDSAPLVQVKGDIRDTELLERELVGHDTVIHLACISNDPSFELDPTLGKSINYDAFAPLVLIARDAGVNRFIYASSSSVYGIKHEPNVTEDLPLEPLTDYSNFKALCEELLLSESGPDFVTLILRPATICGYSPRQRLDLTVNILTNHAVNNRRIKVFGGDQMRPNLHIADMTDLYLKTLEWPDEAVNGKVFNVGAENHSVAQIAQIVQAQVGQDVEIVTTPSDDHRSYHVSSAKIAQELGFVPQHTIHDAVRDLTTAFGSGLLPDPMDNPRYYNVKMMQQPDVMPTLQIQV